MTITGRRELLLPSEQGGKLILCQACQTVKWKSPKPALKRKTLHPFDMTSSHCRIQGLSNYFGNLRVGSEVWAIPADLAPL